MCGQQQMSHRDRQADLQMRRKKERNERGGEARQEKRIKKERKKQEKGIINSRIHWSLQSNFSINNYSTQQLTNDLTKTTNRTRTT